MANPATLFGPTTGQTRDGFRIGGDLLRRLSRPTRTAAAAPSPKLPSRPSDPLRPILAGAGLAGLASRFMNPTVATGARGGLNALLGGLGIVSAFADTTRPTPNRVLTGLSGATNLSKGLIQAFPRAAASALPGTALSSAGTATGALPTALGAAGPLLSLGTGALALSQGREPEGVGNLWRAGVGALGGAGAGPLLLFSAIIDNVISSRGFLNPKGPDKPFANTSEYWDRLRKTLFQERAVEALDRAQSPDDLASILNQATGGGNLTSANLVDPNSLRRLLQGSLFSEPTNSAEAGDAQTALIGNLIRTNPGMRQPYLDFFNEFRPVPSYSPLEAIQTSAAASSDFNTIGLTGPPPSPPPPHPLASASVEEYLNRNEFNPAWMAQWASPAQGHAEARQARWQAKQDKMNKDFADLYGGPSGIWM